MEPQALHFPDDGIFPNSSLPVLLYRAALAPEPDKLERHLRDRDWSNCWRNGVYSYPHYHSTSHEVLVIYAGNAQLHLGGPKVGQSLHCQPGDVLVIPAGVAHQCLGASQNFAVLGAYPQGREWDLLRGREGERPAADQRIARLPIPALDPVAGPLARLWSC